MQGKVSIDRQKSQKEEHVRPSVGLSAFASGSEASPGQSPHVM